MMNQDKESLKLMIIKTKDKVYVSDNIKGSSYFHTIMGGLYFDGEIASPTYKNDWFVIKNIPNKIEKKILSRKINQRYELKEGFTETELTPRIIAIAYIDEDSSFYEVKGLYDFKYELEDEGFENVPFEIHTVEEVEGSFEITRNDYNLQHNLLDKIQTHPILLSTKPCKLTSEESYKIIRNYIKANIDTKYAVVTSDYDFCFTVQKVIELYEPESYTVNINALSKRKKPKYETRFRRDRKQIIYEVAPKPYNTYPVVKPFEGSSLDDLQKKVEEFLNELITRINEPLVECECCKGRGVVTDGN